MKSWKLRNDREAVTVGMIRRMLREPKGWKKNRLLIEIIAELMS